MSLLTADSICFLCVCGYFTLWLRSCQWMSADAHALAPAGFYKQGLHAVGHMTRTEAFCVSTQTKVFRCTSFLAFWCSFCLWRIWTLCQNDLIWSFHTLRGLLEPCMSQPRNIPFVRLFKMCIMLTDFSLSAFTTRFKQQLVFTPLTTTYINWANEIS